MVLRGEKEVPPLCLWEGKDAVVLGGLAAGSGGAGGGNFVISGGKGGKRRLPTPLSRGKKEGGVT